MICTADLLTGCACACVGPSGAAELSSFSPPAELAVVVPLTVVCLYASSCGACGLSAACPAAGYP